MAQSNLPDLGQKLGKYLGTKLGTVVSIDGLEAISGGASRATYRFIAVITDGERSKRQKMILRVDPVASLIETERTSEFAVLKAFYGTSVPVPEMLWIELDASILGGQFLVMTEIADAEANPVRLMRNPYAQHHKTIGQQKWSILGYISKADINLDGLAGKMAVPKPEECWDRELTRWEKVIDEDELEPQPIQRAAIRWLRRNPPPVAQRISIVHGDYRTGNILIDRSGTIRGILDWEMAHLGDPLEDLAWGINRVWCFNHDDRCGGLLPKHEAIDIWERASGLKADKVALHWWEIFSCVKGQAIWISAANEHQSGNNRDSIMALSAWMQGNSQDRATLELLGWLKS